jgi:hypothetical protein
MQSFEHLCPPDIGGGGCIYMGFGSKNRLSYTSVVQRDILMVSRVVLWGADVMHSI